MRPDLQEFMDRFPMVCRRCSRRFPPHRKHCPDHPRPERLTWVPWSETITRDEAAANFQHWLRST